MARSDYDNIVEEIKLALEKDQLFIVRELLKLTDEVSSEEDVVIEFYKSHATELDNIRKSINKTEELLDTLSSSDGWTKCSDKKGTIVYFKKQENSNNILTKLETLFETKKDENVVELFTKIVALFNETDLMPKWFPRGMMKSSQLTQQITKFSKTVCVKISMPRPINLIFSPREANILGQGWDISERSQVVITVTTLKEGEEVNGVVTPGVTKGYAPFILENVYFFELTEKGIIFKAIQAVDLCTSLIPKPLMNFLSKGVLPHELIANLKKILGKFSGSEWEKRIAENRDIYGEIEERLGEFLKKKQS